MTRRLLTPFLTGLFCAVVLAAGSFTEREPNDDPAAPGYAGDIGSLTRKPLFVTGDIARYGETGDIDEYRFSLKEPKTLSAALSGFAGDPFLFLADTGGVHAGVPSAAAGHRLVTGAALPAGTYFAVVAGASGPDADPYRLVIWEELFRIRKAKVKFNLKKPTRDTAKVSLRFRAPLLDPARDGATLRFLGRSYDLPAASFTVKGAKYIYRGSDESPLKKLVLDVGKGRASFSLKGELGDPRPTPTLLLNLVSGDLVSLLEIVTGTLKKDGTVITYRAR